MDKTMDEINEQRQNMQDLTDVLSQPIGAGVDIDEDDLENELKVGLRSQVSGTLLGWLVACRVALTSDGFWLASAREGLSLIDQWHCMPHAVSHSMPLMRDLQVWLQRKVPRPAFACCDKAKRPQQAALLQEMEEQDLDEQMLEPAPVPSHRVPARAQAQPAAAQPIAQAQAVPVRAAVKKPAKTQEELELEQLEAEMAA